MDNIITANESDSKEEVTAQDKLNGQSKDSWSDISAALLDRNEVGSFLQDNFRRIDQDKNGFLTGKELVIGARSGRFSDEETRVLKSIAKDEGEIEELSNDEWGDENDGITLQDIQKFRELLQKNNDLDKPLMNRRPIKSVEGRFNYYNIAGNQSDSNFYKLRAANLEGKVMPADIMMAGIMMAGINSAGYHSSFKNVDAVMTGVAAVATVGFAAATVACAAIAVVDPEPLTKGYAVIGAIGAAGMPVVLGTATYGAFADL